ncbi:solute carrier organic anion transporter family member 74D [Neodiprion fabricii]|uniref:solute carrier organic anion transporter family member 74D n=1 Tax=Neodiprion fabricii TaxID=2872261 RepID=UPI001ED8F860|nr:solute carrier organic anion transporter family member 74D [Neodiprion fabricii]XP_046422581.1 solute carrier organic anion transporter family member 74D [Neodiprion fabricii]XP_046422582.1 solute carrier organic anion transporter family member 74D [Neodiprion fabricii]XP_046422583.1 solute carrier organic anion transporter family member 74D [Neodiprion fabricii]
MAGERDCGVFGFYPRWLRGKANFKSFMAVYSLLGTVQAMSFIYITVTLTTLEKRFKIPSRTTGIMLSGNEVSQVLSIVLIYYGGSGHRPRWIAVGVALSALSCLVLALPHFIYGPGKDALALTKEYLDHKVLNTSSNPTEVFVCSRTTGTEICDEDSLLDVSLLPRVLIFLSQFILGIGTTLYYGLGQTYMDDNTKKKNTPMLLGLAFGLRTLGPVAGFLLSYLCLRLYIDPSLHPVITPSDPRWLGAWWLGWIILGVTMGTFAILVALFPKELPKREENVSTKDGEIPLKLDLSSDIKAPPQSQDANKPEECKPDRVVAMKNFPKALKRLLTNKLVCFNNISAVFYILGASGYITFYSKYMEIQYGTSAGGGTVLAGPLSLCGMVIGFVGSGIVISKYKPGPRLLLGWNVIVGCCYLAGMVTYSFLGCPDSGVQGVDMETSTLNLTAPCNQDCTCEGIKYSPVCHVPSGTTFFSACHAGCKTMLNKNEFGDCSCAIGLGSLEYEGQTPSAPTPVLPESQAQSNQSSSTIDTDKVVKAGPCPRNCDGPYTWFVVITCLMQVIGCSGKIGNVLVNYRAVEKEDKSIAQGFSLMLISLFALIPGPIIYGTVIDSTCLIWNDSCGERGNCWFYHKDDFRYLLNVSAIGFIVIGIAFDSAVWYLAKNLDLYGSDEVDQRREFVKGESPALPVGKSDADRNQTVSSNQNSGQNVT